MITKKELKKISQDLSDVLKTTGELIYVIKDEKQKNDILKMLYKDLESIDNKVINLLNKKTNKNN